MIKLLSNFSALILCFLFAFNIQADSLSWFSIGNASDLDLVPEPPVGVYKVDLSAPDSWAVSVVETRVFDTRLAENKTKRDELRRLGYFCREVLSQTQRCRKADIQTGLPPHLATSVINSWKGFQAEFGPLKASPELLSDGDVFKEWLVRSTVFISLGENILGETPSYQMNWRRSHSGLKNNWKLELETTHGNDEPIAHTFVCDNCARALGAYGKKVENNQRLNETGFTSYSYWIPMELTDGRVDATTGDLQ